MRREREKGKAMKFSDHNLLNFMTYIKISLKWIVNISLSLSSSSSSSLSSSYIRLASLFMIFSFSHQELTWCVDLIVKSLRFLWAFECVICWRAFMWRNEAIFGIYYDKWVVCVSFSTLFDFIMIFIVLYWYLLKLL